MNRSRPQVARRCRSSPQTGAPELRLAGPRAFLAGWLQHQPSPSRSRLASLLLLLLLLAHGAHSPIQGAGAQLCAAAAAQAGRWTWPGRKHIRCQRRRGAPGWAGRPGRTSRERAPRSPPPTPGAAQRRPNPAKSSSRHASRAPS